MRSIGTEGGLLQLAPHAVRAALGQAVGMVEQADQVVEALEQVAQRVGARELGALEPGDVDEGQAEELAGAIVDQELDAMLGDNDVGLEAGEPARVVADIGEREGVFEPADDLGEIIARELAGPRDEVEREQDAQEEQEQLGHAPIIVSARSPAESGKLCPTVCEVRALRSGRMFFRHPTKLQPLHLTPAGLLRRRGRGRAARDGASMRATGRYQSFTRSSGAR
jgi:hypothetical protein